jgi:AraC family transcriptional regulator of adaptative response/methylated-DNA-[protein]-cysteine methyltransferase
MSAILETAADRDPRWAAIVKRDRSSDSAFVYSVRSTGVYCRPSCPARLAKPANVRFHATPADARRAGFRACKRCKPDQPEIAFAIGDSLIGSVLVARNTRGVCAILLGDSARGLMRELRAWFPKARLTPGSVDIEPVLHLLAAPGRPVDLTLDPHGTAFQQRVWQALREIQAGTTVTYAEVARRIGAPGSFRAVAQACGANPIAVAIPCHRVVRSDGGLSGYRWGVARKRALLERERSA